MAKREPEESEDYSYLLKDYNDPAEHLECVDTNGSRLPPSFSFDDGIKLQETVSRLEKELENLSARVGSMTIKNNDETNEETRTRQREEQRVGQLIAEIDSMKKELAIREDNERSLRDQLHRAVRIAELEREMLKRHYEQKILALKNKYEGDSNKAPLRLINHLESQNITYEEESSSSIKNTREVQFSVKLVPNNDIAGTSAAKSSSHLVCHSCQEPYLPEEVEEVCYFHPLPAMRKNKWENGWGLEVDTKKFQNYRYWACCNTLAKTRPVGCCRGRHHQKWEADILLKKAMQEDHWNSKNMLERSRSEVRIITD